MNTNKIATGSTSKRLLAALAVLAVALAVIAAVPAMADSSDAADATYTDGYISAGAVSDGATFNSIRNGLTGASAASYGAYTIFAVWEQSTDSAVTVTVGYGDKSFDIDLSTQTAGLHSFGFTGEQVAGYVEAVGSEDIYNKDSTYDSYTLTFKIGTKTLDTITVYPDQVDLYDGAALSSGKTLTIADGITINGTLKVVESDKVVAEVVFDGVKNHTETEEDSTTTADPISISYADSKITVAGGTIASGTLTVTAGSATVTSALGAEAVVKANYLYGDVGSYAMVGLTIGTESQSTANVAEGAQIVLKADQPAPVVLNAAADTVLYLSVAGTDDGTYATTKLVLNSANSSLSIDSGALEIATGSTLTTVAKSTLSVASSAALKIDNATSAATTSVAGTLTVDGKLALTVVPVYDETSKKYTVTGGSFLDGTTDAKETVGYSAVQAYAVDKVSDVSNNVANVWHDALAYTDETMYVIPELTADADKAYTINQVGYGTAAEQPKAADLDVIGNAVQNDDGTWTFTVPTVPVNEGVYEGVYLTIGLVGGYSITFIAIDDTTKQPLVGANQYVSVPFTEAGKITIPVSSLSLADYSIGGYYKDATLRQQIASGDAMDLGVTVSQTVYVQMLPMYKITYIQSVGGTIAGAQQVVRNATVTVDVAVTDTSEYEFVIGSLKAVYTDASGNTVSLALTNATPATQQESTTPTASQATVAGGSYTFKMPASNVTVTVEFAEIYSATAAQKASPEPTTDAGKKTYGDITFTTIDNVAVQGDADNGIVPSNASAKAVVKTIAGKTVQFTAKAGTDGYGVSLIQIQDAEGNPIPDVGLNSNSSEGTTTAYFTMPEQDVVVYVEYGPVHKLTVTVGAGDTWGQYFGNTDAAYDGGSIEVTGSSTSTDSTKYDKYVAETAEITISVEPWTTVDNATGTSAVAHTYALKSITVLQDDAKKTKVNVTDNGDGTYTFTMPTTDVTVTTLYEDGYVVEKVAVNNTDPIGTPDYSDVVNVPTAAGNTLTFSVNITSDRYQLTGIQAVLSDSDAVKTAGTGSSAPSYTTIGEKYYELSWTSADNNTGSKYDIGSGNAAVSVQGSIFYYDADEQTVTMTMPVSDVTLVRFIFGEMTYAVIDYDDSQAALYSDEACTVLLEDAVTGNSTFDVRNGTVVYVKAVLTDGNTVLGASLTSKVTASAADSTKKTIDFVYVVSPSESKNTEAVLTFTADAENAQATQDHPAPIYYVQFSIQKSALTLAKETATSYIEEVRDVTLKDDIIAGEGTWAESAADIIADALDAVDSAASESAVTAAVVDFNTKVLDSVKATALANLETAYNDGEALDGKLLAKTDYDTAVAAIGAVEDNADKDNDQKAELTAVIEAYDTAMNARTDVQPEPSGAATQVIAGLTGAKQVTIFGVDGYVPAGEISLTLNASVGGLIVEIQATITITNDAHSNTIQFDIGDDAYPIQTVVSEQQSALSSVYAASFHYESGEISSTETAIFQITLAQE